MSFPYYRYRPITGSAFTLLEVILAVALMAIISVFIYGWLIQAQRHIAQDAETLRIRRDILASVMLMRDDLKQLSNNESHSLETDESYLQFDSFHRVPGEKMQATSRQIVYQLNDRGLQRRSTGKLSQVKRNLWFSDEHNIISAVFEEDDEILYLNVSQPIQLRLRLN